MSTTWGACLNLAEVMMWDLDGVAAIWLLHMKVIAPARPLGFRSSNLAACGERAPVKLSGRTIGECESPQ
jgi:hypothetical protein